MAILKGAHKKDPQRYRDEVPKSEMPLGDAPDYMSESQADAWRELSRISIPGVLTESDRPVLELVSCLLAQWRANPVDFPDSRIGHLRIGLSTLGMSPTDRNKLAKPKDNEKSKPKFRSVS